MDLTLNYFKVSYTVQATDFTSSAAISFFQIKSMNIDGFGTLFSHNSFNTYTVY